MTEQKKLLIVIPCLNEERYIRGLITNLVQNTQNYPKTIVIADGGSSDNTVSIVKELEAQFSDVVYLHNPKRIQSAAVNLAVRTYGDECEWFVRLDAHAGYPDDFIQILLEEAQDSQADSVVVPMKTQADDPDGFQACVAAAQNSRLGNGGSAHRLSEGRGKWVDHGHHALFRIEAFQDAGGYDENFSHNEDAELDYRFTQKGYGIWLTGRTALLYYPRRTPLSLYKQYYKFGHGRMKTVLKHRMMPKLRQLIPAGIAPAVIIGALAAFIFPVLFIPALLWAGLCIGYGVYLGFTRDDNAWFGAGFAAMIMHFAWSAGFWMAGYEYLKGYHKND